MADKEIVDRLKAEGNLTRNSGTNSIKAVIARMDKFQGLFESINNNVIQQTAMLRQNLELQVEMNEREARRKGLESVQPKAKEPIPVQESNPSSATPQTDNTFFGGLAALIAGGISGASMLSLQGAILKGLQVGLVTFLAPAIGNWAGDFVEQSLKNLDINAGLASAIGDGTGTAVAAGLVGSIFSKRLGLLFAGAGFLSSFADDLLGAFGFTEEEMSETLVGEFSKKQVAQGVLFAIGVALTKTLTNKAIWSSIFGLTPATATAAIDSGGKQIVKGGLGMAMRATIATAVVSAYLMYGDAAKAEIEKLGVPEGLADLTVDVAGYTATGASIGAMFGPQGALAGAAVGFMLSIGRGIFSWLDKRSKEAEKELIDKMNASTDQQIIDATVTGNANALGSRNPIIEDRVSRIPSTTISEILPDGVKDGDFAYRGNMPTRDVIDQLAERLFDGKQLSQQDMDKIYTDVAKYKQSIDMLAEKVASDPSKYGQDTTEGNSLNLIRTQGIDTDVRELLDMLEELGAKALPALSTNARGRAAPRGLALDQIMMPPVNSSAIETAISGAIKKEASATVVIQNSPTTNNYGGSTNSVSNNNLAVAGNSGGPDLPGYAQ